MPIQVTHPKYLGLSVAFILETVESGFDKSTTVRKPISVEGKETDYKEIKTKIAVDADYWNLDSYGILKKPPDNNGGFFLLVKVFLKFLGKSFFYSKFGTYLCTIINNENYIIMETSSKILDKIKKLMLKQMSAEQIGSTDEAEAFAAKVQELLAKHNLERGAIEFKDENAVGHEDMAIMFPVIGGSSALHILYPIAKYNWCQVYSVGKKSDNRMRLFGTPENREICKYIFQIVAQALIKVCKAECANYKENFQPNWRQSKPIGYDTYARTFMAGAGTGLDTKLRAERDIFRNQNQGITGLVVANDTAVGEYVQGKYTIGKSKITKVDHSTDAFSKGKRAGQEVNITRGINGGMSKDTLQLK